MTIAMFPAAPSRALTVAADVKLAALREQLTGELITVDSAEYDAARSSVYFAMNRRPLAIVRAADALDVAAAVRFANDRGLPLSVRSGGHSMAFFGVVDDAIVVDLSRMKRVSIDPVARVGRVQGGATSGDIAGPAHEHDLALTTGDTASVGIGGLTTGGGVGFMVRKYGLTIDNLISAQVVLANGDIVTASEAQHADLFWAIRGGGGNFGVVTEFTFRLAPVGTVLAGVLALPATPAVVRGYLELAASAPDDLSTIANVMHAPPAPFVPPHRIGEVVLAIIACWTGSDEEGARALAPFRALAEPVVDTIARIPYPEIYRYTDHQGLPHGASIRSMFADDLSDASIQAMVTAVHESPSPFSIVHLRGLGGAMARVSPDATAFAHRTQPYFFAAIGLWIDPADDGAATKAWTEELWGKVRHEGSGVYVNFLEREGHERVKDAYPAETLAKLAAVKRVYDPGNLFRHNQNISPRA